MGGFYSAPVKPSAGAQQSPQSADKSKPAPLPKMERTQEPSQCVKPSMNKQEDSDEDYSEESDDTTTTLTSGQSAPRKTSKDKRAIRGRTSRNRIRAGQSKLDHSSSSNSRSYGKNTKARTTIVQAALKKMMEDSAKKKARKEESKIERQRSSKTPSNIVKDGKSAKKSKAEMRKEKTRPLKENKKVEAIRQPKQPKTMKKEKRRRADTIPSMEIEDETHFEPTDAVCRPARAE